MDLLPLQNRFEVLEKIPDNVPDFTSSDASETGARTAQTKVALINGKTQVRKVPKKSPYQSTVIELSQGNSGGVCNDSHQYYDNSQKMPGNVTTVISKQVVPKNLDITQHIPVECDTSDLDTSVQTQCTTVENFSKEEAVPLYRKIGRYRFSHTCVPFNH